MKNVTITVFVKRDSLATLIGVLKILENLPLENDYVFNPSDIVYNKLTISNFVRVNIPALDFIKFEYCYQMLIQKSLN
tara:strand:+ start:8832 stop:9065 length:234 start_codon:yes stop_codon:yes gene_type:complete